MTEIWCAIPGYEGLYEVSNLGRVRGLMHRWGSRDTPKMTSMHYIKGYLRVGLTKDNKQKCYLVHRLVAQAFLPNPHSLPCVDHINGVRDDNRVDNLRWYTQKDNCNYNLAIQHFKDNRPTKKTIRCIETNKIFNSSLQAMALTGVNSSCIIKCCKGKRKTAGGFHWQYV